MASVVPSEIYFNWFNPATFLCLSQAKTWICNTLYHGPFCAQFDMRGNCLLCWYWWNYWPSLFKLSFHNDSPAICARWQACTIKWKYAFKWPSWFNKLLTIMKNRPSLTLNLCLKPLSCIKSNLARMVLWWSPLRNISDSHVLPIKMGNGLEPLQ